MVDEQHDEDLIAQLGKNAALYNTALEHARKQRFDEAHASFDSLLTHAPELEKAWISWAQMQKRRSKLGGMPDAAYSTGREILERGLRHNPRSHKIVQALGLLALQFGHNREAVTHIEAAADMDPSCASVLRWKPFLAAKEQLGSPQVEQQLQAAVPAGSLR